VARRCAGEPRCSAGRGGRGSKTAVWLVQGEDVAARGVEARDDEEVPSSHLVFAGGMLFAGLHYRRMVVRALLGKSEQGGCGVREGDAPRRGGYRTYPLHFVGASRGRPAISGSGWGRCSATRRRHASLRLATRPRPMLHPLPGFSTQPKTLGSPTPTHSVTLASSKPHPPASFRHGEDAAGPRHRLQHRRQLPQGGSSGRLCRKSIVAGTPPLGGRP
jgi:hypothetical protein